MTGPFDLPRQSEAEQKDFFDAVLARTHEAQRIDGLIEQDLSVASTTVRLAFAGTALPALLLPALAHLAAPRAARPDVVFNIVSSAGDGPPPVQSPVPPACFTGRGDIWTMLSRRVRSAYHRGEGCLSLLDLDAREGVCWLRSPEEIPYWLVAAPFRALFHWWMEEQGAQLLHAAAIGLGGKGLVVTGRGGAGKSTTALACLAEGFQYVGDDYIIVTGGDRPRAHSLYCTAKIDPPDTPRFARFEPKVADAPGAKAVIELHPHWTESLATSLEICAVVTPEFAHCEGTDIVPVSRERLRSAAVFTTLSQLPHAGPALHLFVERLLDAVPGGLLRLGRDRSLVPAALASFLRSPGEAFSPGQAVRQPPDEAPLISVVIPVHNGAHFIAEAVASVTGQHYPALDIIIVDDGSRDALDVAVAALDADVRLFRQANAGPAAARNLGIRHAAGAYIAFLDVDDLWPEGRLEAGVEALGDHADWDVAMGHGQFMKRDEAAAWAWVGDAAESFPFSIPAGLFRRRAFERVGLFDEQLRCAEDTDWFLRAAELGVGVGRIDRTTLLVRRHETNMTFGRSGPDVTPLRLFKNILDRRRLRDADGGSPQG